MQLVFLTGLCIAEYRGEAQSLQLQEIWGWGFGFVSWGARGPGGGGVHGFRVQLSGRAIAELQAPNFKNQVTRLMII